MIEAATLAKPDIVICPFLTSRIPHEIYNNYLTLIIHPGPPGDAGPSALDWVLMGDDGSEADADALLSRPALSEAGRSHWGVTVLQAVEEFDAGPVWAFEQFQIDIDAPDATKSNLYRGPVTRAALTATLAALERITAAAAVQNGNWAIPEQIEGNTDAISVYDVTQHRAQTSASGISPRLQTDPAYRTTSVTHQVPFLGGATHHRPLLKAAQRDFDVRTHPSREISRRIRCADSQPGCLSRVFGNVSLYIYGGTIEEGQDVLRRRGASSADQQDVSNNDTSGALEPGRIVACRGEAVCFATCDGKGVWVSHVRRIKRKCDAMLWPKMPAVSGLRSLGLLHEDTLQRTDVPRAPPDWIRPSHSTCQDVWVDLVELSSGPTPRRAAFVYFEFYNGAMSTDQCSELLEALDYVASQHTEERPLSAVVMMGGDSYFSNGIALNVIEAAADPSLESWRNINRIDDVVQALLDEFPRRNITTVAAIRGNCAAGGVALAAACDVVIAGSETVLNPAYRALGLHGSEYHSLSYPGRCGTEGARRLLRDMLPLSPYDARAMGLVDHTLPGFGAVLDTRVRNHVRALVCAPGFSYAPAPWKARVGLGTTLGCLAAARTEELGEMAKDFWSPRSQRYHARRRDFVRKVRAEQTPLRFATHRRGAGGRYLDEEEADAFDDVATFARLATMRIRAAESERLREAALPLSPADSGIQMDCSAGIEGKEPVVVAVRQSPVLGKRELGPVFSCYYDATV